ncbi:hypothetical protein Pyn_24951 [Prunus yedoensis var. nudiflora]|uniref:Uncharacterized protein n=1 Tax=Prunus yedoensis var. nudiflora TaxID=2094558 RepID=A0A314UEB3_PRUYE|nr:hypothetical protein Pyn_24951 [Prunus yedoensis var. nudiflora]
MAPFKTILFVCVLIAAMSSVSRAQVDDVGLAGVIRIQGTVYCTVNGNVGAAGPLLTLKFPSSTNYLSCINCMVLIN